MNWLSLDYLLQGNERQKAAYAAITKLGIYEKFQAYSPVLVGTIPIDIDIAGSDLDILLEASDLQSLAQEIHEAYGTRDKFQAWCSDKNGLPSYVANFEAEGFIFEFFAQDKPVTLQNGYRHMLIEYRLLQFAGDKAREAIRQMKADGMKTEPAFGAYFQLEGNPYQILLKMADWSDEDIIAFLQEEN